MEKNNKKENRRKRKGRERENMLQWLKGA